MKSFEIWFEEVIEEYKKPYDADAYGFGPTAVMRIPSPEQIEVYRNDEYVISMYRKMYNDGLSPS